MTSEPQPLDRRQPSDEEERFDEREAILEVLEPTARATHVRPGLIRSGAIVAVAVAMSNLLNVAFQLVTARLLPPAEYSLLVTLFSVLLIVNVPILSMQASVARKVAQAVSTGDTGVVGSILIESLRPLAKWGGILFGVGALIAIPFAIAFNVERELPLLAVGAAVLATLPLPVAWGGLQGLEQFVLLGGSQLLYGVLKVIAGVVLGLLGFGAAAIVLGVTIATLFAFGASLIPLWPYIRAGVGKARRSLQLFDAYTRGAAAILILIAALTNLDLIAARVFLDEDVAGAYAAVSVAARSLLLLPMIATTVLFPRVATLRDLGAERSHLIGGVIAVFLLGVVPLILFFTIPSELIEVGFGSDYLSGADWLGPLAVSMLIYALAEVYMFHFLALGRLRYGWVLAGGQALQLVMLGFFHGSVEAIITAQIVTAAVILVASELFDRSDTGRRDHEIAPTS
jgi:O-antigen/teichoic acid export membrane protein